MTLDEDRENEMRGKEYDGDEYDEQMMMMMMATEY